MSVTLVLIDACAASPKESRVQGAVQAVPKTAVHRVVVQVNSDDPVIMKHAITNSLNLLKAYGDRNEAAAVEIVAYGAGVNMFREDTSPVKDLLRFLHATHPDVVFSACGNTIAIMERNEGHPLSLVDGARSVPFGVVRLVELQEAGWSYLRP
ncbi:DsrE family protein [Rhodopseudomonas telluris]|uniref:DsrE family protein n=1 Tax=Rhodopseudomonas telluris TaxID=644215 RepID=A0ABV6ERY7_9BRAD